MRDDGRRPCSAGDRNEVFGELVVGLGEVLVGNYPGSALTFTAAAGQAPIVKCLPSKVASMSAGPGCVIARSDSNGEDLEVGPMSSYCRSNT